MAGVRGDMIRVTAVAFVREVFVRETGVPVITHYRFGPHPAARGRVYKINETFREAGDGAAPIMAIVCMRMPDPLPSVARTKDDDAVVVFTIATTTVAVVPTIAATVITGEQRFWVGPDGGSRGPFAHSDRVARCHLHEVVGVSYQTCYSRAQFGLFYHDAGTDLRRVLDGVNLDL